MMDAIRYSLSSARSLAKTQPFIAAAIATGVALVPVLIAAFNDYRFYVSMGPHGLPDNWWGWYAQLRMSFKARKDTRVPAPYDLAEVSTANGPNSSKSYFTHSLRRRSGSRPDVCGFVAPQRQLTERCTAEMKSTMNAYLDELVQENPVVLQRENSYLEGPFPAVQLKRGSAIPPFLKCTKGEVVHIHPPDGSTHLVLSLADSAKAIEQGWGERHRLSGGLLTWGYTLIYAPRNEEELAVWKEIVASAVKFSSADVGQIRLPSLTA